MDSETAFWFSLRKDQYYSAGVQGLGNILAAPVHWLQLAAASETPRRGRGFQGLNKKAGSVSLCTYIFRRGPRAQLAARFVETERELRRIARSSIGRSGMVNLFSRFSPLDAAWISPLFSFDGSLRVGEASVLFYFLETKLLAWFSALRRICLSRCRGTFVTAKACAFITCPCLSCI